MIDWTHDDARNGYVRMLERERVAAKKEAEDARRLARYDEAKALITELSGALIALHAIVEEEGGSLLLSCPLTDKRARKVYAEACDFLAAEGKVAG
jgi:hypothetical protein